MRLSRPLLLLCLLSPAHADESPLEYGGHTKLRTVAQSYPRDSIFRDVAGSTSVDVVGELRLNLAADRKG